MKGEACDGLEANCRGRGRLETCRGAALSVKRFLGEAEKDMPLLGEHLVVEAGHIELKN